jgi:hypothetical protein
MLKDMFREKMGLKILLKMCDNGVRRRYGMRGSGKRLYGISYMLLTI